MPGVLKRWDATLSEWVPTVGAPAGRTGPLAVKQYNPATTETKSTTSSTLVAVDPNLSLTFIAPPSGEVLVGLSADTRNDAASWASWGLLQGGAVVPKSSGVVSYQTGSSRARPGYRVHMTGLTPGVSYTWAWGHLASGGTTTMFVGGVNGPAVMEVWDAVGTRAATAVDVAELLHVRDEKPSGTHGGTFTAGAWQTRTLNTVKTNEIAGASLTANQVTLPPGTYEAQWSAPAAGVNGHQSRLYNVTNAVILASGSNAYSNNASMATYSLGFIRFTLASETVIALQHQCGTTVADQGFGVRVGIVFTVNAEVYADLQIRRVG